MRSRGRTALAEYQTMNLRVLFILDAFEIINTVHYPPTNKLLSIDIKNEYHLMIAISF